MIRSCFSRSNCKPFALKTTWGLVCGGSTSIARVAFFTYKYNRCCDICRYRTSNGLSIIIKYSLLYDVVRKLYVSTWTKPKNSYFVRKTSCLLDPPNSFWVFTRYIWYDYQVSLATLSRLAYIDHVLVDWARFWRKGITFILTIVDFVINIEYIPRLFRTCIVRFSYHYCSKFQSMHFYCYASGSLINFMKEFSIY